MNTKFQPVKLSVAKSSSHYGDEPFWWVAHPDGLSSRSKDQEKEKMLVENRFNMEILGGVEDTEASYEYDEWALVRLEGQHYLFSTSGCSCPSPSETWRVEIGPASLEEIRKHVTSGKYDGYTLPVKKEADFLALIDNYIGAQPQ